MKFYESLSNAIFGNKNKPEISVVDMLQNHKICKEINHIRFTNDKGEPTERAWLNPMNQESFNYGYFTVQDYIDWMNGTGPIIKGETQEEKDKFWAYAKFIRENKHGWMIIYYQEYFDKLIDPTESESFDSRNHETKTPLKITKTNKEEVIGTIFGYMVRSLTNDFEGVYNDDDYHILRRFRDECWGAKISLYKLGCGYFGYSNTPKDMLNLSWVPDVVIAKAYYNFLVKQGVELPDFDFIKNYKK